ncbi:hypothetical protein GV054_02085 [Marinomonas mediterranea]|jgi:hypothetical protein|nr:carboxypeptidase-like regulatory domain-containing protein [Marinomonas mediterranea]WCN11890.1 hypothetical protein GV054_02085 [Marinomonas mediterranea]WCN15935.1 hypothetical protein GV053_02035 [Marinomonas mediterranea MMB-1]
MNRLFIILLLLSLSGCAVISISPEVEGVVRDSNGVPVVANIEVTHKTLDNKTKSLTTDNEGNFKVSRMRVWTPIPFSAIRIWAEVRVTASGYEPYEYEIEGFENTPKVVELKKK